MFARAPTRARRDAKCNHPAATPRAPAPICSSYQVTPPSQRLPLSLQTPRHAAPTHRQPQVGNSRALRLPNRVPYLGMTDRPTSLVPRDHVPSKTLPRRQPATTQRTPLNKHSDRSRYEDYVRKKIIGGTPATGWLPVPREAPMIQPHDLI